MKKIAVVMSVIISLVLLINHTVWSQEFKIAVVPKGTKHIFWQTVHAGAKKAAQDLNVEIKWRGPAQDDDQDAQIYIIQRAIKTEVDAIVLAPNHEQLLVDVVKQATDQGIKVVLIDSAMHGDFHMSFIATDNYMGGWLAGKHLVSLLNGKGEVMLVRYFKGNASTDKREQGFVDALQKLGPEMKLVLDEYVGASVGEAYYRTQKLLEQVPDIDGIFAPNESTTAGLLRALNKPKYKERLGEIKIVGFDASDPLLEGIKNKHLHGLVVQQPFKMGYMGVKTAVDALHNRPVQSRIVTDIVLVTPENYQDPEIRKILNPDLE